MSIISVSFEDGVYVLYVHPEDGDKVPVKTAKDAVELTESIKHCLARHEADV